MPLNALFARLQDEVVAINPRKQDEFESNLNAVAAHPRMAELVAGSTEDHDFWYNADSWMAQFRPYVVKDSVLYIPVQGVLLSKFPWAMGSYATGYAYIAKAIERGQDDAGVKGIALMVDTFGGEVRECFECAEKIMQAREDKPIRAFVSDHGYSAGYAIACAADDISMSRTAGLGSIGVITIHFDLSARLEQDGVKATIIQSGKFKSDGSPLKPLSAHAKERTQSRIDTAAEVFFEHVAKARPSLTTAALRSMQAEAFTAQEALANNLGDEIQVTEEALIAFSGACGNTNQERETMKTNEQAAPVAITQVEVDSAKAEGIAIGTKQGAVDAKARFVAILGHAEAADRQGAALEMASSTDLDVEAVAKVLAKLPKDSKPAAIVDPKKVQGQKTAFEAAMERDNPEVGAGDDEPEVVDADAAHAARINAAHDKAVGKVKKAA